VRNNEGIVLSRDRVILIVVSFFLVIALTFIAIMTLSKKPASGTLPGLATPVPVEKAPEVQPTEEPMLEAMVSPTTRRLELPPTPTPFRVVSEEDVRVILELSSPDHIDYFDDPRSWFRYDTENATYSVEDGKLVGIDHKPEERYVYWSYTTSSQSGNVYAEISATNGDCITKDAVGFVIRVNPDKTPSGYAFEVACDGTWRFRRHRDTKGAEEFVDWTGSEFILTGRGATNRLGIWGYQGNFVFFVNGFEVGTYIDPDYPSTFGYFAVYVRASQTFDLMATFDDFAFWHIPYIP
jgi:hypothetical protein